MSIPKITFSKMINQKIEGMQLGILLVKSVAVKSLSSVVNRELDRLVKHIREKFDQKTLSDDPII